MMENQIGVEFYTEKTFGLEIEFFGVNYQAVVRELHAVGINVQAEGYNHTTRGHWKLITDASVTGANTGLGRGLELVSPPLKGREGLAEVKIALDTLDRIGAKVDRTCGVHVHHYAGDFNLDSFKNLYVLYYKSETFMDSVLPESRRANNNTYCKSISHQLVERILGANSINELSTVLSDRYRKLNFCSFYRYGTIEFRHHAGSVSSEKITNWILLTQMMVERAKGSKIKVAHDRDTVEVVKVERRLRRTLLGDQRKGHFESEYGSVFKFFMERRRHFASRVA